MIEENKISLPKYSADQSILRTKIKLGIKLTEHNLQTLKSDQKDINESMKLKYPNDSEDLINLKVTNYLMIKYPGIELLNLE